MLEDIYATKLAKPQEGDGNFKEIPNGSYMCYILDHEFPHDRPDSFIASDRENAAKKARKEGEGLGESEEMIQARIERLQSYVPTSEIYWNVIILDDKKNKDDESIRGCILHPQANFVKTQSDNAKIVKYMKLFEGDVKDNYQCVKDWDGKYVRVQVENSSGGYPKANFIEVLTGEDLDIAKQKHNKISSNS